VTRTLETGKTIPPSAFGHAVLRVSDLQRSIAWYQTVLAMEVVHGNDAIAFMTYDDEHHRLALFQTPQKEPAPPGAPGLDHLAYTLPTLGALLGTYRRLEALGILPTLAINHGPTTSLYYADPDGNGIEFQVENFNTKTELQAWFQTDTFAANPLGVVFDPNRLIERYEQGDPIHDLLQPGAAPPT